MKFTQFLNNLYSTITHSDVNHHEFCYGKTIIESDDAIFINNESSPYKTLEEARDSIRFNQLQSQIYQELHEDIYKNISYTQVADIIKEHADTKITNTLIESYIDLAESKAFTTDVIAQSIRQFNKLDYLIENRIDYRLDDDSIVVISADLQEQINTLFNNHQEVIEYMKESRENFLEVINQLEISNGCN